MATQSPNPRRPLAKKWFGCLVSCWLLLLLMGRPHRDPSFQKQEEGTHFGLPLLEPIEKSDWEPFVKSESPIPEKGSEPPSEYSLKPALLMPAVKYPAADDRLFVTLSLKPRILYFPKLLLDEECDLIIALAKKQIYRSRVALRNKNSDPHSSIRNSHGAWLDLPQTGPLGRIRNRIVNITHTGWSEKLQVLRYDVGQHYVSHNDYFDPSIYGDQHTNRALTFFLYLSSPTAGGHTVFPRAGGLPPPPSASDCSRGLRVTPKKGAAVAFYNMRKDYSLDPYSLHGGCDVENGTKWAAPLWFRVTTPHGYGLVK
eukprot:TRINITY_DN19294_c0_g1_i1.p1 TRINITY_DN19294_c0_g1~~TRINITY_DN19294_c0_g1_i1.p1  ORF type:complete len:313 (+),score=44.26 TRINITY_DN19294_c0_g1_i1:133-1071(+)